MKRQFKEFKCECGKGFSMKGESGFYYFPSNKNSTDKEFKLICPSCMEKWRKQWEVKDVKILGAGYAEVFFTNGTAQTLNYANVFGGVGNDNVDAPDELWITIDKARVKYQEEQHKKQISNIEFVEDFDENILKIETFGGINISVRYKYLPNGNIRLDPNVKIPEFLMPQLIEKIREYLNGQR